MVEEPAANPNGAANSELETLLQRYQEGDAAAAAALVERVSPRVFGFLLAQVRDRSVAEDLLQDFWLRIHKARHTYRLGEPVWPWLFAIARRVQIDGYRRRVRVSKHEMQTDALPETGAWPDSDLWSNSGEALDLLKTLPANQREAVLLLKVTGLSLEEAARATGISVGAVKQRAHRAFETLRNLFGKQHE